MSFCKDNGGEDGCGEENYDREDTHGGYGADPGGCQGGTRGQLHSFFKRIRCFINELVSSKTNSISAVMTASSCFTYVF